MNLVPLKVFFLQLLPKRWSFRLREKYRRLTGRDTRSGEPTFVLGVGAQKGGTTWLHNHLDSHPSSDMGFTKEYHVFDALYITNDTVYDMFIRRRPTFIRWHTGRPSYAEKLFMSFVEDVTKYFEYFEGILKVHPTVYLTGDISPCYCGLPVGVLSHIRRELMRRGVRVRVILTMRDPVERCISAIRMSLRGKNLPWTEEDENLTLAREFTSSAVDFRTRYDVTIRNIEAVFPKEEILYLFYEDLFNETSLKKLHDFLDISWIEPEYSKEINVSRTSYEIGDELRRRVFMHYKDVYRFVADKFGEDYISSIWKNYAKFGGK